MSRRHLFEQEPVAELRGLSSLTDPDHVGGVIDVAVFGARGDGKTQFIVHAIRTLRAHAPTLGDAERALNREVLRVVLDARAPRPQATPPGFVPHYTFRVRPGSLLARMRSLAALRLRWRASPVALALSAAAALGAAVTLLAALSAPGLAIGGAGLGLLGVAVLAAMASRRRVQRGDDLEVAFWDIAGEHVYSESAADYYSLLSALIEARKRRAMELGRAYAFAPVLLCNPLALGDGTVGSPFERLRQILPLFAAIDEDSGRALIAINRWSVVDSICERGALRDELVEVTARAHGERAAPPRQVARDVVRRHCLDSEDGRDGDVTIAHLRYDTAIRCAVEPAAVTRRATTEGGEDEQLEEPDGDGAALRYSYDEGPGAFAGETASRFLDWLMRGLKLPSTRPSELAAREAPEAPEARAARAAPELSEEVPASGRVSAPVAGEAPPDRRGARAGATAGAEIWSRPVDSARAP